MKNSELAREPLRPFDLVQNRCSGMRRATQRLASFFKNMKGACHSVSKQRKQKD